MMKPCSCHGRTQGLRTQRKAFQEVDTQLVLIERRGRTPFREGSHTATQVVLVNRTQQRSDQ